MRETLAKRKRIGFIGEILTAGYFESRGCEVVISDNSYDEEKDMLIDGIETEVKTQKLFRKFGTHKEPAFTILLKDPNGHVFSSQRNKAMNVANLIFIERPLDNAGVVKIYQAPPPGNRTFLKQNLSDGRTVMGLLIKDMTLLASLDDAKLVEELI